MTERLRGKTALVTGAAGALGAAGAMAFAREGATVLVADHDPAGLARTVEQIRAECPGVVIGEYILDLGDVGQIERSVASILDRHPVLHLVYQANDIDHVVDIEDVSEADFDRVHDVNLKSGFFLIKYALPGLKRANGASVVNVAAGAGLLSATSGQSLYSSSKGGVIAMTKAQARDLARFHVRVNCLVPGPAMESALDQSLGGLPELERDAARAALIGRSMLKRAGQPLEVAAAAVFLAGPEASYLTGAVIPVDAGWTGV